MKKITKSISIFLLKCGTVSEWSNGRVCKTLVRGFKSRRCLQFYSDLGPREILSSVQKLVFRIQVFILDWFFVLNRYKYVRFFRINGVFSKKIIQKNKTMGKFILAGIVLLLVSLWYFCSRSEYSLRRKLNKELEWLKSAETLEGKVMRRSVEDVLKRHDETEIRIKHKEAHKFLKSNVPCYLTCQRKGPMSCNCSDCTEKSSCMLCKPQKKF